MRIISGRLKGRSLLSPSSFTIRPTSDKVRGSVLNILLHGLGFDPQDKRVLDGFAGTGAFSFEMLSRGALHSTLFDISHEAQKLVLKNAQNLEVQGQITFYHVNVLKAPQALAPAHLVFLDPPYKQGLGEAALQALLEKGWIDHDTLILLEEDKDAILNLEGFDVLDKRVYGRTQVVFLKKI